MGSDGNQLQRTQRPNDSINYGLGKRTKNVAYTQASYQSLSVLVELQQDSKRKVRHIDYITIQQKLQNICNKNT